MRFEIYRHWLTRQFRWRLKSANNRIIACSGESYRNRSDLWAAIHLVTGSQTRTAIIVDKSHRQ